MTALSSSLLEFILGLLSDDEELKKFESDSKQYLRDNLDEGCAAESDDIKMVVDYMKPQGHAVADRAAPSKAEPGHADYQVVKHVTDNHVTNHHYGSTTNNIDKSNWGDSYDVWAEKGSQVALNGGLNFGEDTTFKGDFDYDNEGFNRVHNSGDGSQVAGHDADADGSFNENGSGVQINGEDATIEGDLENNQADNGSVAGGGNIGDTDDDVIVKDNVLQFGENNVNDSENTVNQSDYVAQDVGEIEVEESVIVTDPELNLGLFPIGLPDNAELPA
jgi:hypothetical protein